MKSVDVVKIEKLIPIYKNGEEANAIEVARIEGCEFNIIVGKGLYNVGDEVFYIQPDYCLPTTEMFKEYNAPGGNPKKSRLGKRGRIRALKFNFNFEGSDNPIYSNGIIIPYNGEELTEESWEKQLGIVKYVAPDSLEGSQKSGKVKGDFPYFLYKTDENRIELLKDHINKCADEKIIISATLKHDGSSTTVYTKLENEEFVSGLCTRNQEKDLDQKYVDSYITDKGIELRPHFNKETKQKGWFDELENKFYTNEEIEQLGFESIVKEHRDAWVDTANKLNLIEKLENYCKEYNVQLALRGELIGKGNKGSGNKLNADARRSESTIMFFGVDDLVSGHSTRIHYGEEHNLKKVCEELELEYTKEIFSGVFTYDELVEKSHEIFEQYKKEKGIVIEGLVFRSKYCNKLSTKYINPEYDAKS